MPSSDPDSIAALIGDAVATGSGAALAKALALQPEILAQALAAIENPKLLRRVVGNAARLLPPTGKRHEKPPPAFDDVRAGFSLHTLLTGYRFDTVLDVGAGAGTHARIMRDHGKTVTKVDFGTSKYARAPDDEAGIRSLVGDANSMEIGERFDCVWASHVLEHQPNVGLFIERLKGWAVPDGLIAITVPPLKFELVGGHLTLWTPGSLIYNLVFAGLDCSDADLFYTTGNITAIVRNRHVTLPDLDYDSGDIRRLKHLMPPGFDERVDGFAVALKP